MHALPRRPGASGAPVPWLPLQQGAGTLEIALVITCLVLTAVVAVPRQADFAREARRSQTDALARTAAGAARLAHSLWLAEDRPPVLMGPQGAVAMANGYPSAGTLPLMLAGSESSGFDYAGGRWQHADRRDRSARCGVDYAPPESPGGAPRLAVHLEGC